MTRRPRVAVYGGDDRSQRLTWPSHLDIRFYPYRSPRSVDRLVESAQAGGLDHVIILTSFVGHGYSGQVEALKGVNVVRWPRSAGQLSREIGNLIPPVEPAVNPLLRPSKADDPYGGGRGPDARVTEQPHVPMFEHVVTEAPRADETLGKALWRILRAERMTQVELCKMLGKPQPTVSAWMCDRARPRDMGPLVDLWPELARFDLEHEHRPPPNAAETEAKAKADLDLVRSVKLEEPKAPQRQPDLELEAAIERLRNAKREHEEAERALFELFERRRQM